MSNFRLIRIARWSTLAAWLSITVPFWAYVGIVVYLGSGLAEPAHSAWPSLMILGVISLAFAGWAQGTRLLFRWACRADVA